MARTANCNPRPLACSFQDTDPRAHRQQCGDQSRSESASGGPWKEPHNCTQPVVVAIYRGSLCMQAPRQGPAKRRRGGGIRGKVFGYSDDARLRLIRRLSQVDARSLDIPIMVTLTYHHGHQRDDTAHIADRRAWIARIRRRYPEIRLIWRLELQRRGAPHYHVILWLPRGDRRLREPPAQRFIRTAWHDIADASSRAHERHGVAITALESRTHGYKYLAKYVAKEITAAERDFPGRRWGMTSNVPTRPRYVLRITEDERRSLLDVLNKWLAKRTGRPEWADWYTGYPATQHILADQPDIRDLLMAAGIDIPPELEECTDDDT